MVHYEHIGYDPAPGNHEVTGGLAAGLTSGHETLERVRFLLGSVDEGEWVGETAIAFRSMLHDGFEPKVIEAEDAFRRAADALETWAGDLRTFRDRADALNRELGEAKEALGAAESNYYGMPEAPRPQDDAPAHAWDDYQEGERARLVAQESMDDAQGVVNGVWDQIRLLVEEYGAASRALLGAFETAAAMAPDDPSLFERAVDWVGDELEDVGDLFAEVGDLLLEWAAENAGFLNELSNWLSLGSMVFGFASLIPGPWSPFLAGLSVGLGVASTLSGFLAAAGEGGSWSAGFTPGVIAGAIGTALGAGAVFATFRAVSASATAAGRVAPTFGQFMNPLSEAGRTATAAFPGFFSMAARGTAIETTAELGWRALDVTFDQATWFVTNPIGVFNMAWDVEGSPNALTRTQAQKRGAL
ncbi:putative T7SS-secreted protein [Isoptericola sp. BMS4]|uniref:putative T7SS-secreted protein n=1 Tax=Isoptericola sp. BMS4 TaxID=2527875 RepID=UPI001422B7D6|nr:hypothetical protein [Isoptericola sp. BMS4]